MKTQLIIALDFQKSETALDMVRTIGDAGDYYKVGLELFIAEGYRILPALKDMGKKVFLDLKIHDIPNTAAQAILSCISHGADMVDIHVQGGVEMMRRSKEVIAEECDKRNVVPPLLVGITLLTSLTDEHLSTFHISDTKSDEYVLHLAKLAKDCGLDGVVSSAREIKLIKDVMGKDFITVTPGIRLPTDDLGDQKRVVTPAAAAEMGADYIVVGRPITAEKDPKGAVEKINGMLL